MTVTLLVALIFLSHSQQQTLAIRELAGEKYIKNRIAIQSLQRGPVPPSAGSPCSNIPGRDKGRCPPRTQMNVAGYAPPLPDA
ncbi:hypothetical protein Tsubulata_024694 [Turnera subulata]|uniref:Uncharacterized protein n=1 Tax=Turnera subulata TaxID=218843 RepID=A0A9Q0F491_9ROSI|nr:hypothetical protein Tsubulata_024694 [Turnera subulata]